MTPITTTKAKLLFVEVPDDAKDIRMDGRYIYFQVEPKDDDEGLSEFYPDCCPLPSGSTYIPLFTTKQATEEDWKGVVESEYVPVLDKFFWVDYESGEWVRELPTATESGLSLQKAHGMDVNKNYAVIEVKN